ncbi:hypothetical protein SAMN04488238_107110 [Roseicitreum antarcticum]|uniref:Amine oxidase domain-containing protein n=2 Tax=Roseicitreum antarcticum TaxID=564137 RepID=A0A1H3ATG9_9RHOB|nr:hypothetical protein SAMN04488238_107110 [Roseicitreum antarcticum]
MAGVACGRALADAGHMPLILDKGRGIGGRIATRRSTNVQFDHGAQYVTARHPEFAAVLDAMRRDGAAANWVDGTGRQHVVGTPGMSALVRYLAKGLDIRQQVEVTALHRVAEGWQIETADRPITARRIIVTTPAPQTAALLGPDHVFAAHLSGVEMAPCLTLMATTRATPAPPFVSQRQTNSPLAWIAQDSHKPGRAAAGLCTWVAQASAEWSARHLEHDKDAIAQLMLPLLCTHLGISVADVESAAAHRWRYARVNTPLGQPFLRDADASVYAGGDWCLGPRVEAAWQSGTAIAHDILG